MKVAVCTKSSELGSGVVAFVCETGFYSKWALYSPSVMGLGSEHAFMEEVNENN